MAEINTLLQLINHLGKDVGMSREDMAAATKLSAAYVAKQTAIDVTAESVTNVQEAFVSAVFEKYEGAVIYSDLLASRLGITGATEVSKDNLYVAVAKDLPEVDTVRFGEKTFRTDNRVLTMDVGNGTTLKYEAWVLDEGKLLIAVPMLFATVDFSTGVAKIVADGISYDVEVCAPVTNPLVLSEAYSVFDMETGEIVEGSVKGNKAGVPDINDFKDDNDEVTSKASIGAVVTLTSNGTAVAAPGYIFGDDFASEMFKPTTIGNGIYTLLILYPYAGSYNLVIPGFGVYQLEISNKVVYNGSVNGISTLHLNDAIATVLETANEATVTVTEPITEQVTIPEGKTVTLTLAEGVKLTNLPDNTKDHTLVNKGTLVIDGDGVFDNTSNAVAALHNAPGAECTILSGEFTRTAEKEGNTYYAVQNYGTMVLGPDVYIHTGPDHDGSYGSVIENGWYNGKQKPADAPEAYLTINGATIIGGLNAIKNDDWGHLTINDGYFENTRHSVVVNPNVCVINGGKFVAKGAGLICNDKYDDVMDLGDLTIYGGEFIAEGDAVNFSSVKNGTGQIDTTSSIKVYGGTWNKEVPEFCIPEGYKYNPVSGRIVTA